MNQMEAEEPDRSSEPDDGDGWINPFTACVLVVAALSIVIKWVWGGLDAFGPWRHEPPPRYPPPRTGGRR
jgi:hypothetical protein